VFPIFVLTPRWLSVRYVDEFRNPQDAKRLVECIRARVTRPRTLMEVCGGQTHSLLRHGIGEELRGCVELIHGPGCPVCVTPQGAIDHAIESAQLPGVILTSFGDMLRVPGSRMSLLAARAAGAQVLPVYSPLDAVALAQKRPSETVVFFAVGFETTAPATALAVLQADQLGLKNFLLLVSHVRVQPAMELLASDPASSVEGFLAAGHVCTVMGYASYEPFVEKYRKPVVVTGFEPTDLLEGVLDCVDQLERGAASVRNRYGRAVRPEGNRAAREMVDRVYEPWDLEWRGLGVIPRGGFRLREPWRRFDAAVRWPNVAVDSRRADDSNTIEATEACPAGEVLAGRLKPPDCPHYGKSCVPESPLGAPMVSAEGACAAYYRYGAGQTR
jgi:hydrogenase expression/formation protein HypD